MEKQKEWAGTTYGNGWMHRSLISILRCTDIRVLYAFVAVFVVPACLVLHPGRRVMYRYFRQRWSYSPVRSFFKTYRNFYLFAQAVLDKFAMYAGKTFCIDIEGYDAFQRLADRKEGFLQLSAHVGNYEIAGYTLVAEKKRLHALVFSGEKDSVMDNRTRMFNSSNIRMIGIKSDMSHMFSINNALTNGEIVSIPADRMLGSQKSITRTFLGAEAQFPYGPFAIGTSRALDVVAVNVMKTGTGRYTIFVTPLPYDKGAARSEQIEQLSRAYVDELERLLNHYPEQWYNYYDFWT